MCAAAALLKPPHPARISLSDTNNSLGQQRAAALFGTFDKDGGGEMMVDATGGPSAISRGGGGRKAEGCYLIPLDLLILRLAPGKAR